MESLENEIFGKENFNVLKFVIKAAEEIHRVHVPLTLQGSNGLN